MYPDNIYIQNYDELKSITKPNGDKADMGVQFDIFDQRHGLEHNDLLRAVETGVDKLLSLADKKLLGL